MIRRLPQVAQDAADRILEIRDAATDRLKDAWVQVYGRNPDPGQSYQNSIRAIEAAAKPVICPNDPTPTLGKILSNLRKDLKNGSEKWEFVLADGSESTQAQLQRLISAIEMLWEVQRRDRHGEKVIEITNQGAECALHYSIAAVHSLRQGFFRRRA